MTSGRPDAYWEATLSTLPSTPPNPNPFVAGACTPVPSQGAGEKGYFVILLPGRDSQKWCSHNKMVNNWQLLCVCASFRGRISLAGCYLRTTPIHRRPHTHTPDKYPIPSRAYKSSFSVFLCRFSAFFCTSPPIHSPPQLRTHSLFIILRTAGTYSERVC